MYNNPFNYYPYMANMTRQIPVAAATRAARPSFFKSLAGIKWGNVLTNTQKTLNVINQAIPVYYQIKPIYHNLKSFGKIMNAFNDEASDRKNTHQTSVVNNQNNKEIKKENSENQPTFFIN